MENVMDMEEKKEGATHPATTTETNKGIGETDPKGKEKSGKNAAKPKDTGVDTKGKEGATGKKGAFAAEIEAIAQQTFEKVGVDTLYFTSDKCGFITVGDARNHAARLREKTIIDIKRR
jgi:hypothetical protein